MEPEFVDLWSGKNDGKPPMQVAHCPICHETVGVRLWAGEGFKFEVEPHAG